MRYMSPFISRQSRQYTIAVENEVSDNMYQQSELDYLIYNEPIGYADLVLNGTPENY